MKTSWTSARGVAFEPLASSAVPSRDAGEGHEHWGPTVGEGPRGGPGNPSPLPCSCDSACSAPQLLRLQPGPGAWGLLDASSCPGRAAMRGSWPAGSAWQGLAPSHEADGADKACGAFAAGLPGAGWLLPVGFVWQVGASSWTPGAPSSSSSSSSSSCSSSCSSRGGGAQMWVQVGELRGVGSTAGAGAAGGGWGPLGGWAVTHGEPESCTPLTPKGHWQGSEEANPKHCITARELFSSVCFSPQEKTRLFLRLWLMLCDLWHHHGSAGCFALQVKPSRQRFASVLGSS